MKKYIFALLSAILLTAFLSLSASAEACSHVYDNGFCTCGAYEPCSGSGSLDDPYLIGNGGELYWFADLVNGGGNTACAKLTADVRINTSVLTHDGKLAQSSLREWIFIGYESRNGCVLYNGTFEGGGHTVSGIYCDSGDIPYVGLFGNVGKNGNVKNVSLADSYVGGFFYAGGIAGYNKGTVENCHSYATVTGSNSGGIAGYNDGMIKVCTNNGSVFGDTYAGGIVSESYGPVRGCENSGAVFGSNTAGGIAGDNFESLANCKNLGIVSGTVQTGGVVGGNYGKVENCDNSGDVTGTEKVGGVVGCNGVASSVSLSYNSANVSGNIYVGGVAGHNLPEGHIESCYNLGSVSADATIGGVVGFNGMIGGYHEDVGCVVKDCYSIGTVTGKTEVGGIAGHSSTYHTVTNCYYDADVFNGHPFGGRDESNDGEPVTWVVGLGSDSFKNGEVAYLLGEAFGQIIGSQDHPIIGGDVVYKSIAGGCTEASYYYTYSNTEKADVTSHRLTDATCTAKKLCSVCGYTEGEPLGHDFEETFTVDREPSENEPGLRSRHCTRCDERTDVEEFIPLTDSSLIFTDVKKGSWFKAAVDYAVTKDLMNGMTKNTFEPNTAMSRAMLVTVLWRLEGSPKTNIVVPFTDLKQAWYRDAVAWAYANGVVMGTGETSFSPNGDITREQMAAILYRYSARKGADVTSRADLSVYPDSGRVHAYAADAVSWANAEGLITGSKGVEGSLLLAPQESATRAQIATILMRFCEKY